MAKSDKTQDENAKEKCIINKKEFKQSVCDELEKFGDDSAAAAAYYGDLLLTEANKS